MSPAEARAHWAWSAGLDFTHLLDVINVPTRVLIQDGGVSPLSWAERMVGRMPLASLHVMPAPAPGSSIGEGFYPVIQHLLELGLGPKKAAEDNRFLGTVLFTDMVSSTQLLAEIGDEEFQHVRSIHERAVRAAVSDAGGQVVNVSGDGTFSLLDMPAAAVTCADRIARESAAAGIGVRCGVHTGELQREGQCHRSQRACGSASHGCRRCRRGVRLTCCPRPGGRFRDGVRADWSHATQGCSRHVGPVPPRPGTWSPYHRRVRFPPDVDGQDRCSSGSSRASSDARDGQAAACRRSWCRRLKSTKDLPVRWCRAEAADRAGRCYPAAAGIRRRAGPSSVVSPSSSPTAKLRARRSPSYWPAPNSTAEG
jgi:hypothetical protein